MDKPLYAVRLAELRNGKGFTQQQVADMTGLSRARLNNYEQGVREPDLDTVTKLADFLGVSVDYLLGRDKPAPTAPSEDLELIELARKLKSLPEKDRKVVETIIKLNELADEQAPAGK
ncbi:HTH-type transcriptional regulator Xre [Sporomusa carbonis]|uniref:helix-turn-helix domain-containing protein n=1 Tax=Sporomusa carbonis TaxID=3076075 RepID=UPI003A620189